MTRIFYKGAHVVFLCYDITREDTFRNLRTWLNDVRQHASDNVLVYLIGSKSDLVDDRQVEKDDAIAFCQENNIAQFFETSSMTGHNVEEVFSLAAKDMYVKTVMKAEEDKKNGGGDDAGGSSDPKSKKRTSNAQPGIQLKADNKKSLD